MKTNFKHSAVSLFLLLILFIACDKDNDNNNNNGQIWDPAWMIGT